MTKNDVDELLGQEGTPVKIPMLSRAWRCMKCGADHVFDMPVKPPAPCTCESICFTCITVLPH